MGDSSSSSYSPNFTFKCFSIISEYLSHVFCFRRRLYVIRKPYVQPFFVRKLFSDYVGGTTIKELVDWLKISGIRSHRGNVFSFGRVSDMLHNPKYIGKCKYGGETYDNMIEPIIDEETFYRAQEKLTANIHKAARSKAAEKFILSGKLICSECGELMVGESGTSKTGEIYTYYKCAAKKKNAQNCTSKAVRKEVIEKAVYNAIIRALQDDNFIFEVARKAVEIHNADIEESAELKILNRQKADIDKQLANITNAICQGIFNAYTQAKMIELSNTQQALEAQIADEQAKTIFPLKEARVISFLKNYTEIVKCADKAESLENMKRLFDVFIKEVIFDGERFLIIMKTTDEPLNPDKEQKEEAIRKKFELLRFGDPYGRAVRFAPLGGFATANLSPIIRASTDFPIIRLNSYARLRLPSRRLGFSFDGSQKIAPHKSVGLFLVTHTGFEPILPP